MEEGERWYLAALVDGEGSIGVYKTQGKLHLSLRVAMIHKPTILWLREKLGGSVTKMQREGQRIVWAWTIRNRDVGDVLGVLKGKMRAKEKEAELAGAFVKTLGKRGRRIPERVRKEREEIARRLKEEKKRVW